METQITMEDVNEMEIGNEQPPIEPAIVEILRYEVKDIETKNGISNKLVFTCKHPSKVEIDISGVKMIKNNKLKSSGLWFDKDKEGNIPYASGVAEMMRFCKVSRLPELIGKSIVTTTDDNGYLVFKLY